MTGQQGESWVSCFVLGALVRQNLSGGGITATAQRAEGTSYCQQLVATG